MTTYSKVLRTILLPTHNLIRSRRYTQYRDFLESSQTWSRDRLAAFQWQELSKLIGHAYATVPFYQARFRSAGALPGDIRTMDDFRRLPLLTREDLQTCLPQLRSMGARRSYLHSTGGSSGMPVRFYVNIDSFDWRTAATERAYSWSGCRVGERTAFLWGAAANQTSSVKAWKKKAFDAFRRELIISTFAQTSRFWQETYERLVRFRPVLLVGYASSLHEFCRYLAAQRLSVPGIRSVISGAEPLFESAREEIQNALRVPVFNTYGSREFMSIAGECEKHDGLHIHSENLLIETVAARGASEILVTDLHNYATPFIRYSIGDIGELDESPCSCGRSLPRLRSIQGRLVDIMHTADNRAVCPIWFPHIMKEIPEVHEFQAEQATPDRIVIRAILCRPLSDQSRAILTREIAKVFGPDTRVELEPVQTIERLPSGKRRFVIASKGGGEG